MTTPAISAWFDQRRRQITEAIRRHGSWLPYISDEADCVCCAAPEWVPIDPADAETRGPAFCYTIGLYGVGHPELLVYGLDRPTSATLLNSLVHQIREHDQDLTSGDSLVVDALGLTLLVEQVPNPGEIVLWANDYWERPQEASVPVLQLTWADPAGRYAWEPDCAEPAGLQPRPGTHRA